MHFSFHFLVRAAAGNIQVLQTFNSLLIRRREKVGLCLETKWPLYCPQGSGTLRQQLLMMHGIALYCIELHGIAWYCIVLHDIAW